MATYTTDKVKYNGNIYKLQDSGALQLTGGTVTGPVTFNDSVSMDEATVGDLVVNGNLSTTNNIQANTINGVSVGSSPKFTDTVTTASTTGSGNAVTSVTASNGVVTVTKGTTFLTSHQDISGKADKSATVSTVAYDSTNKKLTKTINGTTSDIVTVSTLKSALSLAKGDVGLGNVENKSSATIRGELTKDNVTTALGYTPPTTNTTYSNATTSAAGLMSSDDKSKLNGIASGAEVNQNAFSNVKVGSTTVAADGKTDTLELAGSNVTLTPDATNDKVTIGITKANVTAALGYTPPTTDTNTWRGIQNNLTSDSTSDSLSAAQGKALANGSARDSTKLPLAGGSMTGTLTFNKVTNAISYTGTKATYPMIKFKDNTNDEYGNGIVIGGGGLVVIGGGESADTVAGTHDTGGDETLELTSDGAINAWTNVQSGTSSAKKFTFGTDGVFSSPGGYSGLTKANVTTALGYTPPTTNTTYSNATTSAAGLMSSTDKSKLDGIAAGAQVNAVTSVASKTGAVTLAKGDVGLGNVANIDQSKAIKGITRSGTTFTYTCLDGTTGTFTQQDNNTTYSAATTSANGLMSSTDKSKLDGIASGAEVNQNAFSNVKVGSTTVAADGKTDTLELVGSNVTLTPDATNDKVTIGITKANVTSALGYTPPTTNTTYSNATTSAAGLMSSTDKSKLDGIAAGAQVNAVTSVAGKTGAVTLAKSDVGLGNVENKSSATIRGELTSSNVTTALGFVPKIQVATSKPSYNCTWFKVTSTATT